MHETLTARWNEISLRTKITAVTVLLVTLGLLVAGIGTRTVLRNYLLNEVDSKISSVANTTRDLSRSCAIPEPNEYFFAVVAETSNELICENDQPHEPSLSPLSPAHVSRGTVLTPFTLWDSSRSTQWRVVALPRVAEDAEGGEQDAVLVVALSLDETNRIINQYAGIFFGFGISVVVLGAALTRLLVTSTFTPLRQVEATAAAIAEGNFSERLPGDTPNTEVGRLNRSLNTMLARIDRAFADRARTIEQMRRFVGDASHELRTPLVSVRGYAELYRMGAITKPEEVNQAMERIEKEAIRMGELVEDLLELARLDEAKPLQLKPVDLVPIAYDAALDAMASSPGRTVSVVIADSDEEDDEEEETDTDEALADALVDAAASNTPASRLGRLRVLRGRSRSEDAPEVVETPPPRVDVPAVVLAEENKIRQVVTNLLGNAMRFTDAHSPIEIGVNVDHRRDVALIDIIDHGEGIPPQIRDKIFQRFWRADTSRTRETGGSGLGLAIVSGIVRAHHGTVEVHETDGGGATFRIVLPLLPADWEQNPSPARA
jgi:two-component system OmpR family sensor kinase